MSTALTERIDWCRTMANNASYNDGECEGYIAEMAGLMDVPLAASLELHQGRYDLGCRDRQTLMLLADSQYGGLPMFTPENSRFSRAECELANEVFRRLSPSEANDEERETLHNHINNLFASGDTASVLIEKLAAYRNNN